MKKSVLFIKQTLVTGCFIALSASNAIAIAGGGTQGPDVSGDAIRPISPSTFVRTEQFLKIEQDCMDQILETHLSNLPANLEIKKIHEYNGDKLEGYKAKNDICFWAIDSDQADQITIFGRYLKVNQECAKVFTPTYYENEVINYKLTTNEDAPKVEFNKSEVPSFDSLSGEIISKTNYYSDIKITLRRENMNFRNTNTNRVVFSYPSAKYASCLKSGLSRLQSRK
ncbi:MAG: hypothetical protein ACXVCP_04690 [Bdellovibrio sp.]